MPCVQAWLWKDILFGQARDPSFTFSWTFPFQMQNVTQVVTLNFLDKDIWGIQLNAESEIFKPEGHNNNIHHTN